MFRREKDIAILSLSCAKMLYMLQNPYCNTLNDFSMRIKLCHIKWSLVCSANILFTLDQIPVPKDTIKDMSERHRYWFSLEYWVLKMQSVLFNSED